MIYRLSVPGTIEDCDSVRILEWHRSPGDAVEPGDLVLEMETHKALIEVRSERRCVLRRIDAGNAECSPLDGPLPLSADPGDEPLPANSAELAPWIGEFTLG